MGAGLDPGKNLPDWGGEILLMMAGCYLGTVGDVFIINVDRTTPVQAQAD